MVMIGICLQVAAVVGDAPYSYFLNIYKSNKTGSNIIMPIIILWLFYISSSLARKSYKNYDLFLRSTASISFFSSYFYLIIIAFISAILTYLSKYPVLLILLIFSPNDWLVLSSGLSSLFHFVSYCFGNYLLIVTLGFMGGIIGARIIVPVVIILFFSGPIIGDFESNMLSFWVGIVIVCGIITFVSHHQYKRLDVR